MEWELQMHQMSLFFLFSHSCYHVRYSFVPCKYVPGCYHSFHVILPSDRLHPNLILSQSNEHSAGKWLERVCFSLMCPVMKSGFTEARGRGNSRSGGPNIPAPAVLSRCTGSMWQHPRQEVWERSKETFKLIIKVQGRTKELMFSHIISPIISLLPAVSRSVATVIYYY